MERLVLVHLSLILIDYILPLSLLGYAKILTLLVVHCGLHVHDRDPLFESGRFLLLQILTRCGCQIGVFGLIVFDIFIAITRLIAAHHALFAVICDLDLIP